MQLPAVEQDLELFEKPPPIEPAATISSMGEVAAAVQEADLAQPPVDPAPETQPIPEQFSPAESAGPMEPAIQANRPESPSTEEAPPETTPETQPEQSAAVSSPMELLANFRRGDS